MSQQGRPTESKWRRKTNNINERNNSKWRKSSNKSRKSSYRSRKSSYKSRNRNNTRRTANDDGWTTVVNKKKRIQSDSLENNMINFPSLGDTSNTSSNTNTSWNKRIDFNQTNENKTNEEEEINDEYRVVDGRKYIILKMGKDYSEYTGTKYKEPEDESWNALGPYEFLDLKKLWKEQLRLEEERLLQEQLRAQEQAELEKLQETQII